MILRYSLEYCLGLARVGLVFGREECRKVDVDLHEGAWSEGATRNREMIKAAQRTAHDIERDAELREPWVALYAVYRASEAYEKKPYHFYQFVYVTIYREMQAKIR